LKATRITLTKRLIASIIAGLAGITPMAGAQAALFRVSATVYEQIGYQPDLGCYGGAITGSGISSFGSVSIAANDCITPAEDYSYFSFQGKMTFTLFSGDEIFADYSGLFVPTRVPSIFTLKDSFFDITGGTGRFLRADGGGNLFGTEGISSDFSRGVGFIQATGNISDYKKSKKGKESRLELLRAEDRGSPDTMDKAGVTDLNGSTPIRGDLYKKDNDGSAIVAINQVPESGSLALLGIGLASLAFVRRNGKVNS
jgi:hypothetical protein